MYCLKKQDFPKDQNTMGKKKKKKKLPKKGN